MRDLAEQIAMKFFEAKKELELHRISYSKTSLEPARWKDCPERERMEWIESAKRLLADEEILQTIYNRAQGI